MGSGSRSTRTKIVLVDDEDAYLLRNKRYYIRKGNNKDGKEYVFAGDKSASLARDILGLINGGRGSVRYIDSNPMNCCKSNLRVVGLSLEEIVEE